MTVAEAIEIVSVELERAMTRFPVFNTPHEAYAVTLEELDELWIEIKHDKRPQHERVEAMRREATQVAAMALRLITDLT